MKLFKYFSKKILMMIGILLFVSLVIFFMIRIPDIDPISVMGGEKTVTAEARAALTEQYHLNEPLLVQYGIWVQGVLKGDFGLDFINRQSVKDLILPRIPVTMGLVFLSMLIATLVAIPFGILSALKKNTWVDQTLSVFVLVMASTPNFMISIVMVILLAKFFPSYKFIGSTSNFSEFFQRIAIPAVALSFSPIALMTRVTRSSMIEQMKSPYITTVRAKGLPSRMIIFKHALHNGVLPVLTIGSMMAGTMIAGAVLVETVFSLPGMGSLLITAIKQYNYPIAQILLLILLSVFLLISTVVDLLYAAIDPRIKV